MIDTEHHLCTALVSYLTEELRKHKRRSNDSEGPERTRLGELYVVFCYVGAAVVHEGLPLLLSFYVYDFIKVCETFAGSCLLLL